MARRTPIRPLSVALASAFLLAGVAQAYDESIDPDLSSDPSAPTVIGFSVGSNLISGTVTAAGDIRDYWTFSIGAGESLTAIDVISLEDGSTGGPANRSFIALHPGTTSAIPSGGTIGGFLGGDHLDAIDEGTNVLLNLSFAPLGGTGFSTPLGAGDYTFHIQQTSAQVVAYVFDFVVVPEPGTALLLGLGLGALATRRRAA